MPPTDDEVYKKNVAEQYEAIGRFVEAFERMVHELRETSVTFIERDGRHTRLVEVALHHQVLTAKPLFEIFRAITIEIIDDAIKTDEAKSKGIHDVDPPLVTDEGGDPLHFTTEERNAFLGVMTALAAEFEFLLRRRNELLHATWFVGYVDNTDPNAAEFYAQKFRTTKTGLSAADMPKNAGQIKELTERCAEVLNWIAWLHSCVRGPEKILERFKSQGRQWWLVNPGGSMTTFPEKSS